MNGDWKEFHLIAEEAIRQGVLKFGPVIAKNLRAIRPKAYIRPLAAQYGSNELPAVSGFASDILDGRAVARHR